MMRFPASGTQGAARSRFAAYARMAGASSLAPFDGYQFSLLAPPVPRATPPRESDPYAVRAVAPALRPLVRRYNSRCPECAGPLVSGEGAVACPVCGFSRRG
jgi:hypothetical protein